MKLPSSGIKWSDYRNSTPTFDLTPVEKPDFSPFLIHMTGKKSLVKILNGEGRPVDMAVQSNHGYLKSSKPTFDGQEAYYNSEVVCFTESPIFALDFFRYRSYRRWSEDQQYGIGFSKKYLVMRQGVRPVIYLDNQANSQLLALCNNIIDGKLRIVNEEGEEQVTKNLFETIKPLLFPLLESTSFQGFMWEREWRYPGSNGLDFPYEAIRIICCPANEKDEILGLLGDAAEKITVVECWREYDDVTDYLKRRASEVSSDDIIHISEITDVDLLEELKQQNEVTLHTLESYYGVFRETVTNLEGRNIKQIIGEMKEKSRKIESHVAVLKRREEEKKNAKSGG